MTIAFRWPEEVELGEMFGQDVSLDTLAAAGEGAELALVLALLCQEVAVLLRYAQALLLTHVNLL